MLNAEGLDADCQRIAGQCGWPRAADARCSLLFAIGIAFISRGVASQDPPWTLGRVRRLRKALKPFFVDAVSEELRPMLSVEGLRLHFESPCWEGLAMTCVKY